VATEPVKLIACTRLWFQQHLADFGAAAHDEVEHAGRQARALMMSASAQALPGTRSAGLSTTQLPKASAGAIFQAGIAIGKFQGVMRPMTPTGSRVISTPTPGRTEGTTSPRQAQAFAGEELEDLAGAGGLADAFGQGLAFFARQQVPSSFLAGEDFGAGLSSASKRCWAARRDAPGRLRLGRCGTAARLRGVALRVLPTTSRVSEGLTLRL
jgi:hypothetical protein